MPEDSDDVKQAYEAIPQFPHCDARVLHRPKACTYCDAHADWQALRILWNINFSGESDPDKHKCPSEEHRPAFMIHRWPGNQATEVPVRTTPKSIYELIKEKDPV